MKILAIRFQENISEVQEMVTDLTQQMQEMYSLLSKDATASVCFASVLADYPEGPILDRRNFVRNHREYFLKRYWYNCLNGSVLAISKYECVY